MINSLYQSIKLKRKKYPISPFEVFKVLIKSQYWPREKLKQYQLDKLNKLLSFSKENSAYYSLKLKDIVLPITSLEDFESKIPFLTKATIIDDFKQIKSKTFSGKYKYSTSGSSGDPLTLYISGMADVYRKAGLFRFKSWWGVKPFDKSVLIWRFEEESKISLASRVKRYFRFRYDVNVSHLNDHTIIEYFNHIEKFKPKFIRGYKSGVLEFAELFEKNNLTFKKAKLKVIIVTSEILLDDERAFIERVLKCKVANEYGAAEAGYLAYECPNGSMHLYEEANYIWSDKNANVYISDLFNFEMPLINYKNDDILVISNEKCSCNRSSRIVKNIIGRESGYIQKPDGSKLNQVLISHLFKKLDKNGFENCVKKFKVIQLGDEFTVYLVPLKDYRPEVENYIEHKLKAEIDQKIKVKIIKTKKIMREKSGKLRYFIRQG